jgi:molybdopterin molybdotransferase
MHTCDVVKSELTSYEDALQHILDQVQILAETETVPLYEAYGRVLAQPVVATVDVPPADNSEMDGYAVISSDIKPGTTLPVSQRIPAGIGGEPLVKGTVARIFTGAPIPEGADAVVMQELVTQEDKVATFQQTARAGDNIRKAGEDIRKNSQILQAGIKLQPQDIGLMASVGVAQVDVYRRFKVAIFFTGDELVEPGKALDSGQIYNSNQYTLYTLLQALNCEIINLGIVPDTLESTRAALQEAANQADLVITTGGVSVGEEDHVRIAVEQIGQINLWQLKMKPGKPFAMGKVDNTDFIGLPGNPVSVFATFCLFARPFILKAQGLLEHTPKPMQVTADFEWLKPGIRREFLRARINATRDSVSIYPHQGSGVLSSTSWANGFAVVPENTTVQKGDKVSFIPFSELLT